MNFLSVFNNKTIRIPLLQRDYVQGCKESIISPFIDSLLDVEHESDLNYIYGYTEDDCFVPVDGQQRLTTLWLLYLYCSARAGEINAFNVSFSFLSREYAQDFCERLSAKLPEVLSKVSPNDSLDICIREQYWFINSWFSNGTVKNMLLTLKYIHRKCGNKSPKEVWEQLISERCNITFAFLDMSEDNGLDDDIYIKMNGRGRPLSVFENLKSWMDEQVSMDGRSEQWSRQWKTLMDNQWTQLFWDNRNLSQEHPEEIDDEQLYCFCNLLLLYWFRNIETLKVRISTIKAEDIYLYEELIRLYPKLNEKSTTDDVILCLFESIQKSNLPSLIWIERLNLMPRDYFLFVFHSMNTLCSVSYQINDLGIYCGGVPSQNKLIYELSMCEATFGRTLPLLYSIILLNDGMIIKDWMRICRNLILNTAITQEKLPDVLATLDSFAAKVRNRDIYSVLASDEDEEQNMAVFDKKQLLEEKIKAQFPQNYRPIMENMENSRFFAGKIGVVFRIFDVSTSQMDLPLNDFISCAKVLMTIFDGSENGVNRSFDRKDERLLRRTLMSIPPHLFGFYKNAYWCFCNTMDDWRTFLNDSHETWFQSFKNMINNICLPGIESCQDIEKELLSRMQSLVSKECSNYETKIEDDNSELKYYLHFVHHVGTWEYMNTFMSSWPDNDKMGNSILLKKSDGNNSNRIELRTYCLYLDYLDTSVREELIKARQGWHVGIWPRENTCMYFDIKDEVNQRVIAIDVFHNRTKEDDYKISLFVRPIDNETENLESYIELNRSYFDQLLSNLHTIELCVNEKNGRYQSLRSNSRSGIINDINSLLYSIKDQLKNQQVNNGAN